MIRKGAFGLPALTILDKGQPGNDRFPNNLADSAHLP
jgi:hypothetical protein